MAFVSDTFTDANGTTLEAHTGETGATWAKHATETPATAVIASNRARPNGATAGFYYASGSPASAEYDVQSDLFVLTTAGNSGVAGRIDTASRTGYLWRSLSGGDWQLYKDVAGTFTLLGSSPDSLSTSTAYVAKLGLRDAAKKGYVGGVELVSTADNAITGAGKAGVWVDGALSDSTGIHLDNFSATNPGGGGGIRVIGGGCGHRGVIGE